MTKNSLLKKVESVLKEVEPMIQSHGGGIKILSAEKGKVKIEVQGVCVGCPMAQATFDDGIKNMIQEKIKEVKKVEFVTRQ